MFNSTYQLEFRRISSSDYKLSLPICPTWDQTPVKVLIVLESVDGQDAKANTLLAPRSRTVLVNVIKAARQYAREFADLDTTSWAAINFSTCRTYDLDPKEAGGLRKAFADRVKVAIRQLRPTHVLVCGDVAFANLFPDTEAYILKRGWVFDKKLLGKTVKVTPTFDLERLYTVSSKSDDDDEDEGGDRDLFGKANLLGHVIRHLGNLLCGRLLFDVSTVKPRPIYVDTLPKFHRFMDKLYAAKLFGYDTETKDLSVLDNPIYTMQFAFDESKGFVIPYKHPKTPFSRKDLKIIGSDMREFWTTRPADDFKQVVGMNLAFDTRVTRAEFKFPVVRHALWDIMAGETSLDENVKFIPDFGNKFDMLYICCSYGNDQYLVLPFSKSERHMTGYIEPSNPDFLDYAALDAQLPLAVRRVQLARAKAIRLVTGESYGPIYHRYVSDQMSDTSHVIAQMVSRGVHVDMYYLSHLKSKESPLLKVMNDDLAELRRTKEVVRANKILTASMGAVGTNSGGLFGQPTWVFDAGKPQHQQVLFYEVMKLKPVSYTKKTNTPQTDKKFQAVYAKTHRPVELFASIQKIKKLWGTYIKGWFDKIVASPDSAKDHRLRPSYGWWKVVSGRLNSFDPSLQQVPNRSAEAKHVKRAFVAQVGHLLIKFDYSAHEVRVWAIISGDKVLAAVFRVGQDLRKKLRKVSDPAAIAALLKRIKAEGDIHVINVKRFFGMLVDKDHPLRDAIKAVVFGVLYGKGPSTLARDIEPTYIKNCKATIAQLEQQIVELEGDSE